MTSAYDLYKEEENKKGKANLTDLSEIVGNESWFLALTPDELDEIFLSDENGNSKNVPPFMEDKAFIIFMKETRKKVDEKNLSMALVQKNLSAGNISLATTGNTSSI